LTARISADPGPKPRDDELDLFGLTHPGKVRSENQDHFLLCTVHPQVVIHATSLPEPDRLPLRGERLATIMLVPTGSEAARRAAKQASSRRRRSRATSPRPCGATMRPARRRRKSFTRARAVFEAHDAVRAETVAGHSPAVSPRKVWRLP
jgi:protein phosphatase